MVKQSFVEQSWAVWGHLVVWSVGLVLLLALLVLLYGVAQQLTAILDGVLQLI